MAARGRNLNPRLSGKPIWPPSKRKKERVSCSDCCGFINQPQSLLLTLFSELPPTKPELLNYVNERTPRETERKRSKQASRVHIRFPRSVFTRKFSFPCEKKYRCVAGDLPLGAAKGLDFNGSCFHLEIIYAIHCPH